MTSHFIDMYPNGSYLCKCGFTGTAQQVLDHALPLNIRNLAEKVAADPKSTPDMIARTKALLVRTERLYSPGGAS